MMKTFSRVLVSAVLTVSFAAAADTGAKTDTTTTKTTDTSKTTTTKPADAAKPAKLKDAELQVMAHYHAVNLMEIDLGNAAAKKGTTDGVKSYGKMLVKDHQDADKALKAIAAKTHQVIPAKEKPADDTEKKEMADDKAAAAKLKTMKGADFDKEYLRMMVQGHEKELAKIDAKVGQVENAELADMLKGMKPTLQHHADEARDLQKNSTTSMNDMSPQSPTGTTTTGTSKTSSTAKR